jgi:hypothetical protein
MKTCSCCHQSKDESEFAKDRRRLDGVGQVCAVCHHTNKVEKARANSKAAYEQNKERRLQQNKEWYAANRDQKRATIKAWSSKNKEVRAKQAAERYIQNKELINAKNKAYYWANLEKEKLRGALKAKRNPGAQRARVALYRAAKLERTPEWLNDHDKLRIRCVYQVAAMRNSSTDTRWEVDHIIPLQGESVSGLHVPWNLQIIPITDNRSKGNKLLMA